MTRLENEKEIKTEEVNSKIKELEESYNTKKEELEKEYELKAKNLKLERDREVEEYNYKLKRDREITNNKWEDEKNEREKILKEKENKTEELLKEAELKAEHVKELEVKVAEIPELLQQEYERGKKEAVAEIQKENKYTTELLKKDFQNTIDRQNDKIESLQEELKNLIQKKRLYKTN